MGLIIYQNFKKFKQIFKKVKEVTTVQRQPMKDQLNTSCSSRVIRVIKVTEVILSRAECAAWSLGLRGHMHRKFSHSKPPNEQQVTDLK